MMRSFHLLSVLLPVAVSLAACGGKTQPFIECRDDFSCDRFPGGRCLVNPETAHQFCAYPDADCESGMRWSDLDVEEAISGACVAPSQPDAGVDGDSGNTGETYELTVMVGGNGSGTVTSDPPGINCTSGACMATFDAGQVVTLSAEPSTGVFLGWSDACSGTAGCSVTLSGPQTVGALFGVPGEALWVQQVGDTATGDTGYGIAVDPDDNVVVIGNFSGTVTLGGTTLTSAGQRDIFVAKLRPNDGTAVWAKRFGGSTTEEARAVAVDANGDVFVTGSFTGSVNFGGSTFTSAGSTDIYVLKLAGSDGGHVFSRAFGSTDQDMGRGIAVGPDGTIGVAGTYRASLTFGGATINNAGVDDMFVVKLNAASGDHVWSKGVGGASSEVATSLVVDGDGNVVVVGYFYETCNFGGGNKTSAGFGDVFVAKYAAANGAHLFSNTFGSSTGFDTANDVALNPQNQLVVLGYFDGTINLGGASTMTSTNGSDMFLAKYSLAGAHLWSRQFGGTGQEIGNSVFVNAAGNVAVTGTYCGTISFGGEDLSSASACAVNDVFVATFEGVDGDHLGSARYGGTGHEVGLDVTLASDGRMFATGQFSGFAEFGGEGLTSAGGTDAWVLGLAPFN